MKSRLLFVLLLGLGMTIHSSARALDNGYIGVNFGLMEVDNPNFDPAFNVGITVGAIINQRGNMSVALEGQLTTTAIEGDTSAVTDWEIDTLGIYGALRLGKAAYFKLKGGYVNWDISFDTGGSDDDGDLSWGLGFGLPMRSGNTLELEYTIIGDRDNDDDISYLSLTYLF